MRDPDDWQLSHHNTPTPVAGVVMLVALAVVVGSVAVVYLLEFGGTATGVAPIVAAEFALVENATGADDFGHQRGDADVLLRVSVSAGETTNAEQLYLRGASSLDGPRSWAESDAYGERSRVAAGSTLSVWVSRTDRVSLIWRSADGARSAVIDRWQHPDS